MGNVGCALIGKPFIPKQMDELVNIVLQSAPDSSLGGGCY